jgi:hypothetical protein
MIEVNVKLDYISNEVVKREWIVCSSSCIMLY